MTGNRIYWTGERIARLGFLVGLGWDAKRISRDPVIASTSNNVYRQSQRFGLSFICARVMQKEWPLDLATNFKAAAEARGIDKEELSERLLLTIASDVNLIDNILDDAEEVAA